MYFIRTNGVLFCVIFSDSVLHSFNRLNSKRLDIHNISCEKLFLVTKLRAICITMSNKISATEREREEKRGREM